MNEYFHRTRGDCTNILIDIRYAENWDKARFVKYYNDDPYFLTRVSTTNIIDLTREGIEYKHRNGGYMTKEDHIRIKQSTK